MTTKEKQTQRLAKQLREVHKQARLPKWYEAEKQTMTTAKAIEREAILNGEMNRIFLMLDCCANRRDRVERLAKYFLRRIAAAERRGLLAIAADREWRYSHGEIEASCGGELAVKIRGHVMARRAKIRRDKGRRK